MNIKSISWQNIGSFGNKIQTLNFSNDGELWQLYGKVGHGKSTILSLPTLVFYGKLKDTKIGEIANRVNKHGWIKCECVSNNNTYIIERTFSPNSLSISKNGEVVDRARDMQSIIENEIVGLPYNIFTNILSLSLNNFKSFINMTPNDKRQIIDKIFSLDIINKIFEMIKKDEKDIGQTINVLNSQIFSYEETIKRSQSEIERIKNNGVDGIDEKITNYNNTLNSLKTSMEANNNSYTEHKNKLDEVNSKINEINININSINNDIKNINDKLSLFNQHKCPLCGNNFDTDDFLSIKNELLKELNDKNELKTQISTHINTYIDYRNKLNSNITIINTNITNLKISMNNIINELNNIKNRVNDNSQYEAINNIINSSNESIKILNKQKDEHTKNINYLHILNNVYGGEGVKKMVMDNYIPMLNNEIANILAELSFPYSLEFDSNFNAHLLHLDNEISTSTLSTGETKKVDLAVLISIIKIIKFKYPNINLICLDETVSSIDSESCLDIIKVLQRVSNEMKLNMLIVSHVQLPIEFFNKRIEVEKITGFSDLNFNN